MRSLILSLAIIGAAFSSVSASAQTTGAAKPPAFSWVSPLSEKQSANLFDGVEHRTFMSPSMKQEVGYYVYLPSAYETAGDRSFPVVLHLHGGRPGSEAKAVKLATFVDAAIKAGEIQPTIYVFSNGGPVSWYNYPDLENGQGEDVLVKELIPHLKESFRMRELAIEGFSQGGRGTTRIMFRYPELFSSAAPGGSGYSNEKRVQENDGKESDHVIFAKGDNTWDLAANYAGRGDKDRLPVFLWVGTKGFNFENNLEFSAYLQSLEIPHEIMKVEGADHSASRIYELKGLELMQFHQQHFAQPAE